MSVAKMHIEPLIKLCYMLSQTVSVHTLQFDSLSSYIKYFVKSVYLAFIYNHGQLNIIVHILYVEHHNVVCVDILMEIKEKKAYQCV